MSFPVTEKHIYAFIVVFPATIVQYMSTVAQGELTGKLQKAQYWTSQLKYFSVFSDSTGNTPQIESTVTPNLSFKHLFQNY